MAALSYSNLSKAIEDAKVRPPSPKRAPRLKPSVPMTTCAACDTDWPVQVLARACPTCLAIARESARRKARA